MTIIDILLFISLLFDLMLVIWNGKIAVKFFVQHYILKENGFTKASLWLFAGYTMLHMSLMAIAINNSVLFGAVVKPIWNRTPFLMVLVGVKIFIFVATRAIDQAIKATNELQSQLSEENESADKQAGEPST